MSDPKSRTHHVFVERCGCPIGLVSGCPDEEAAWDAMYETRAQERAARGRGIRVEFVDHDTYQREFYPLMIQRCPH
jgi:hypothetical protein